MVGLDAFVRDRCCNTVEGVLTADQFLSFENEIKILT
jgi:hypothetical protein